MVKRAKKSTRRNKRSRRVNRRSRRQRGGWQTINPTNVGNSSMAGPSQVSGAQGTEYKEIHKGQYGGGGVGLEGAPVGTTGVLDESLRATARVSTLDDSVAAIQGMSDQSGGRRKRRRRGSKKRGSRRSRRRHSGGGALNPSDYSASTHLLSPAAESKALMQMSPEWKLAENPSSFAPRS
jgi:hypothetical protein